MLARLRYYWTRFRLRPAIKALAAYSAAKDEYRRAVVAGDTRRQHHAHAALTDAMTARLRAEAGLTGAAK